MDQSDPLNHALRKRIYQHIVDNPGITFKMLERIFAVNKGTLNYHLDYLRKVDLIEIRKRKNERIYLPREAGDPSLRALKSEQKIVLRSIRESPGSDIKDIVSTSGLSRKDVTKVLAYLRKKRLIRGAKNRKSYGYRLASDEDIRNEVFLILIDKYSRGEIPLKRLLELKSKLLDEKA
jgi:predicted transcriptional regulator